ncbi:hypothetical protein MRX96_027051 [Rhipicephalus microplus]
MENQQVFHSKSLTATCRIFLANQRRSSPLDDVTTNGESLQLWLLSGGDFFIPKKDFGRARRAFPGVSKLLRGLMTVAAGQRTYRLVFCLDSSESSFDEMSGQRRLVVPRVRRFHTHPHMIGFL